MVKYVFSAAVAGMLMVSGCQSSSGPSAEARVVQQNIGSVNPYLWRASLDTFENMPVATADPIGGLINYDWKSFETAPNERARPPSSPRPKPAVVGSPEDEDESDDDSEDGFISEEEFLRILKKGVAS